MDLWLLFELVYLSELLFTLYESSIASTGGSP